jgi:hypothetical protein
MDEMARDLSARSEDFAIRVPHAPRLATDPALVLRAAPVGYRLEQYTGSEARVAFWAVAIGAGVPGLPLTTAWGTEVLTLRWVAGDWRIAAIDRTSGPVPPDSGGEATAVATARMQQFQPFGYGPGSAP